MGIGSSGGASSAPCISSAAGGTAAGGMVATADGTAISPSVSAEFDTFVFDLDGTILDTLPDLVVLTNMVLVEEGYPKRTQAEVLSYVGNGVRALMYQAVPAGTPETAADRAMERWKALYPTYANDLTRPYPHIVEMARRLRAAGCKLGVLSNKFDGGVQQIMAQYLPGLFDVMHGESEDFPRKPDPTGLLRTIGELGSAPGCTVYVGDSPGDVVTARNAGCCAVAVSWGYHPARDFMAPAAEPASIPDEIIDDPLGLLELAVGNVHGIDQAQETAQAQGTGQVRGIGHVHALSGKE